MIRELKQLLYETDEIREIYSDDVQNTEQTVDAVPWMYILYHWFSTILKIRNKQRLEVKIWPKTASISPVY